MMVGKVSVSAVHPGRMQLEPPEPSPASPNNQPRPRPRPGRSPPPALPRPPAPGAPRAGTARARSARRRPGPSAAPQRSHTGPAGVGRKEREQGWMRRGRRLGAPPGPLRLSCPPACRPLLPHPHASTANRQCSFLPSLSSPPAHLPLGLQLLGAVDQGLQRAPQDLLVLPLHPRLLADVRVHLVQQLRGRGGGGKEEHTRGREGEKQGSS